MTKHERVTVEYEYKDHDTGAFGVEYAAGETLSEVQAELLRVSRGGDVEVIKPKRVR